MTEDRVRLLTKFQDPEYRHAYVESFVDSLISAQIRELRKRRGWDQKTLADKVRTTQSAISRLERPDYSSWRIETLHKLAGAFDVAFIGKFVSFGDALDDIERFSLDKLMRPEFSDDPEVRGFQAAAVPLS
jgi:transcriptional regulator with XRE-family HTH domain